MRGYRRHGTNMPGGAVGPVSVQHLGSGAADAQGTIMPGGVVGSPVFSVLAICGSSCGPSGCHGCGCSKGHRGARRGCKAVAVARGLRYWVVDPHGSVSCTVGDYGSAGGQPKGNAAVPEQAMPMARAADKGASWDKAIGTGWQRGMER